MDINTVINFFGGRVALAKALKVTPQAVHKWMKTEIPPARAIQIEKLTNGEIQAVDLVKQQSEAA